MGKITYAHAKRPARVVERHPGAWVAGVIHLFCFLEDEGGGRVVVEGRRREKVEDILRSRTEVIWGRRRVWHALWMGRRGFEIRWRKGGK